ncbi:relaxase MobL, partial [Listeria booriae]
MSSPGVIVKYRYTAASANEFQKYIDYIDRSEAVRKDNVKKYSMFNDYMGNPEKTSALFTQDNDQLNRSEKRVVKEQFEQ